MSCKRVFSLTTRRAFGLAIALFLMTIAGTVSAEAMVNTGPWEHLPNGEYVGTVPGMWGDITVMAILENGKIVGIEIVEGRDDLYLYDDQYEEFVARILGEQRLDVDVITGASVDCEAILAGLYQALEEAEVKSTDTE